MVSVGLLVCVWKEFHGILTFTFFGNLSRRFSHKLIGITPIPLRLVGLDWWTEEDMNISILLLGTVYILQRPHEDSCLHFRQTSSARSGRLPAFYRRPSPAKASPTHSSIFLGGNGMMITKRLWRNVQNNILFQLSFLVLHQKLLNEGTFEQRLIINLSKSYILFRNHMMTLALNLLHGVGIWLFIVNNICKSWQSTLENMGQAWCSIKVLLEGATVAPSHFLSPWRQKSIKNWLVVESES